MSSVMLPPLTFRGMPFEMHQCKDCGKKFMSTLTNCGPKMRCPKCRGRNVDLWRSPLDGLVSY